MKKLTEASISRVKQGAISITRHLEPLNIADGSAVLIIRSRSGFLRVIPMFSKHMVLLRLSLDLNSFADASHRIYSQIRETKLRLLHSTGFCPLEDVCLWEGYFAVDSREKIEEFANWLHGLDIIHDVIMTFLDDAE